MSLLGMCVMLIIHTDVYDFTCNQANRLYFEKKSYFNLLSYGINVLFLSGYYNSIKSST